MKCKPRKTTVRGELRYYIETEDPLTGKRKRQFFDTLAKAQTARDAVNQTPHPTRRIDPALDPERHARRVRGRLPVEPDRHPRVGTTGNHRVVSGTPGSAVSAGGRSGPARTMSWDGSESVI